MEYLIYWLVQQPDWSIPLILIGGLLLFAVLFTAMCDLIEYIKYKI